MFSSVLNKPNSVIVDYFNFVGITGAKNKANAILIIDPNTPLPGAVPNQLLQFVARWHSQKSDLSGRVDQQQFSPGTPRDPWRHNSVPLAFEKITGQLAGKALDRHKIFYLIIALCQLQLVVRGTTPRIDVPFWKTAGDVVAVGTCGVRQPVKG